MSLAIDYEEILQKALEVLYPDVLQRNDVQRRLQSYGSESFHSEIPRVRLGILYLASQEPGSFASHIDLARTDYRDLLCAAEYPYSSRESGLKDKDPEKYRSLQAKERAEYLAWVASIEKA